MIDNKMFVIAGKKADQEVKSVQLKKLIEFFLVSEVSKFIQEDMISSAYMYM